MKNALFLNDIVEGHAEPGTSYNKFQNEGLGEYDSEVSQKSQFD